MLHFNNKNAGLSLQNFSVNKLTVINKAPPANQNITS